MRAIKTILAFKLAYSVAARINEAMDKADDMKSFLSQVDSIQRRFLESLITGQRDAIFRGKELTHRPDTDDEPLQTYVTRSVKLSTQAKP
jgi:hypothetical protein